jgi:uncharacterized protein (TIGR03000 family)
MRARYGLWCFGLTLICGVTALPQRGGSQLLAQPMPSPSPNPLPPAAPQLTQPGTPPGGELAAPSLRPNERPLPINLATAFGIANVQPWDVQAASERVRVASAQLLQSSVLWVPSMYTGGVYQTHAGATQSSDGAISTTPNTGAWEFGTTPQFQFAFTEAIFEPLAARRSLQAQKATLQAVTNDTTYAVARAYFDVLEARGDLAAAGNALKRSEVLIGKLKGLSPDYVPEVEVARAQAQYAKFRQLERSARERWNVVSAELVRLLRLDPTAVLTPLEPPQIQITLISPDQNLETLLPVALMGRPELTAYRALSEFALKRWREEQFRPFLPLVFARGNSTQTPDPLAIGVFGGGADGTMGNFRTRFDYEVQVLWELKNMGFGNAALMKQKKAEYEVSKIQAYRMQDLVAREVSEAFAQMQSARDRVAMAEDGLKQALSSANDNYKGVGEVKRVGGQILGLVIRPLEAIAAEQALLSAYYDYFGAVGDYNRTQFQLYRALGNPAQALPLMDQLLEYTKAQANPAPQQPGPNPPPAPNAPPVGVDGNRNGITGAGGVSGPAAQATPQPTNASLHVRVPANAELYCDDIKLTLAGNERNFISPPLPPGRTFPYIIRARWTGPDGKPVEQVRQVQVEAGKNSYIDFLDLNPK